jgi:hypothetical protein
MNAMTINASVRPAAAVKMRCEFLIATPTFSESAC